MAYEGQALTPEIVSNAPGAIEQMERAEVDVAIATAKKYPRDIAKAMQTLEDLVTSSWEIAADCVYGKPVSGDLVTGPSVRFAEMLAYSWQNIRAAWRLLEQTETQVHVQGIAHDLQTNNTGSVTVTRPIRGRNGKYPEHLIATTIAAAGSIAYRNAIFKVIPPAIARRALEAAEEATIERRDLVLQRLHNIGVDDQRIYARFDLEKTPTPEALQRKHLKELVALGTAIHDGELSIDDAFPKSGRNAKSPGRRKQTEGVSQPTQGQKPAQKPADGENAPAEAESPAESAEAPQKGAHTKPPTDPANPDPEPMFDPETGEVLGEQGPEGEGALF